MSKKQKLTFEQNNQTEKHLQPYCTQAAIAAVEKDKADALRPLAAEELKAKLASDPETKDFTGTVVYICDGQMHKIRVQRPDNTNWLDKRLNDPDLKELKTIKKLIAEKEKRAKELVESLTEAHPRCVEKGFVMAYLR